jgi:predicted MFS family arabinose efflux permease
VASGFSIASIFGVPAGLELAHRGGWRAPFLVVGGIALLLAVAARLVLPRLRAHMDAREAAASLPYDARVWLTFAAFGFAILGNFLLVPNIPAYIQFNLGFPRERMGLLYLLGGLASLGTMRVAGAWTDRSGAFPPVLTGTAIVTLCLVLGLIPTPPILPPLLFFSAFMGANAARWVSINAIASRVPHPSARARFLSAQNAFSHAACAAAAMGSTLFLTSDASGRLGGMSRLAAVTATMGLFVPLVIWRLEKLVPPAHRRAPEPLAPTAEI